VTAIAQALLAASVAPQVLLPTAKSPLTTGAVNAVPTPPLLVTVIFCAALVAPSSVATKVSAAGFSVTAAGASPVPLKATLPCPPLTFA